MATLAEIMKIVIGPISVLFRSEIPTDEERRYNLMVDEYVEFLKPFEAGILADAMYRIRETYKHRAWPKQAHILDAIREVSKDRPQQRTAIEGLVTSAGEWVAVILNSEWKALAQAVNGLGDLKVWAGRNPGCWPTEDLIEKFRIDALRHDRLVVELEAEPLDSSLPLTLPMRAALLSAAKAMQDQASEGDVI